MSCVERSKQNLLTLWQLGAPWEVRTVTSTLADDSLSTLLLQLSSPLPPSLSLCVSLFTLLFLQLQSLPISGSPAGLTLSSSECRTLSVSILSSLPLILLPHSLSTHSVSLTHTYVIFTCHFLHLLPLCLLLSSHTLAVVLVQKSRTLNRATPPPPPPPPLSPSKQETLPPFHHPFRGQQPQLRKRKQSRAD